MRRISVLLVDDHAVVRQGLRALLESEPDLEVVGEAENGHQAVVLASQRRPEVIVMDVSMPVLNGVDATRQIVQACPETAVLVLSSYSDSKWVEQALRAGAAGYLIKQSASCDLSRAIREVRQGQAFFSPVIAKQVRDRAHRMLCERERGSPGLELTLRETEVLCLVTRGFSNKEAGVELSISVKTIEKHRQNVMNKLGIHETAGLTRYAIAEALITA